MGNQETMEGRELTTDELDIEGENQRLMFYWGATLMGAPASVDPETLRAAREALWRLTPYIKALATLAHENPGEARERWAQALREPMPFGGEAIGMPRVANLDRARGKGD